MSDSIGNSTSRISVRYYHSIPVADWVHLFRYRTVSDIGIIFHSGIECQTVRHSGIYKNLSGGGKGCICTSTFGSGDEYTLHVVSCRGWRLKIFIAVAESA